MVRTRSVQCREPVIVRGGQDVASRLARRGFLGALGAAAWASVAPAPAGATIPDLRFTIHRKGRAIGSHVARFTERDGLLEVATAVDIRVKLAFVTVFAYRQEGVERFSGDHLVGCTITTDDDGERSRVEAELVDGLLRVEGARGAADVPLGVLSDLGFWNPAIIRQDLLLDSKTGEVSPLTKGNPSSEQIEVAGLATPTRRHDFATTRGRSGTVWYDDADRLVRAEVHTRGEVLDYRLA